ncbi:pyridoxal-dependent decarboxylase [Asanoa sp. NPDC049518]|uniref:pyridoxal phosphate-dependent decarboxylase family protein n=1 Tax=unclassified Asanoa TaxID=2685164 RepID=UPI003431169B
MDATHPPAGADEPAPEAFGVRVAMIIERYLADLPSRPVFTPYPANLAAALAAEPVPAAGSDVDAVFAEFLEKVAPYPFGNGHPRFAAWVNSPPHPLGIAAEALAATMNPSVAGGNHAAVHVEHQVVRWFAELAGFGGPPDGVGLLVSGGSAATLTAFAAARHRAAARAGIDVRTQGLQGHGRRFLLYVGEEGHGCARKAAELLGIGSAQVRTIGSDEAHRMRPDLLRAHLERDRAEGGLPVAVMASAGTTGTGAVDPIGAIADACAEQDVWLHVDGAYGGPAVLLLERYAYERAAIARADSLALDPHKWLYTPVDAGLLLLRDQQGARDTFSLVPPYLRTDEDPDGVGGPVWFSEYGFDQTRPFRALKLWFLLKHLGTQGYRARIARDVAVAARLASTVDAAPDLELLAHGLSVVCFRCRPAGHPTEALDDLNRAVLRAVQLGGRAFFAGTTLDGVFALRACVVNFGTTASDVDAMVAEVRATLARHT